MGDFQESQQGSGWDGTERRTIVRESMHEAPQGGIRFDATINLGHILTFLGFVVAGFTAWTTLDKRVTVLESNTALQAQVDKAQDQLMSTTLAQIRENLADIKTNLAYLNNRRQNMP